MGNLYPVSLRIKIQMEMGCLHSYPYDTNANISSIDADVAQ